MREQGVTRIRWLDGQHVQTSTGENTFVKCHDEISRVHHRSPCGVDQVATRWQPSQQINIDQTIGFRGQRYTCKVTMFDSANKVSMSSTRSMCPGQLAESIAGS